jgi:hypothetical protein
LGVVGCACLSGIVEINLTPCRDVLTHYYPGAGRADIPEILIGRVTGIFIGDFKSYNLPSDLVELKLIVVYYRA